MTCRYCGSDDLEPADMLGNTAWCRCTDCGMWNGFDTEKETDYGEEE